MTASVSLLPPAWQALANEINGRLVFGSRGVRDPDALCEAFDPVENLDWLGVRVTAPGNGDCSTDGHYLCLGCRNLSTEAAAWRFTQ